MSLHRLKTIQTASNPSFHQANKPALWCLSELLHLNHHYFTFIFHKKQLCGCSLLITSELLKISFLVVLAELEKVQITQIHLLELIRQICSDFLLEPLLNDTVVTVGSTQVV